MVLEKFNLVGRHIRRKRERFEQARASFEPYTISRTWEDITFQFLIEDPNAQSWYDTANVGLDRELAFIRKLVQPGDSVVDCGAHHGFTTLVLSHLVGSGGKVVAIEALPENHATLTRNLELNGVDNTEAIQAAVGPDGGTVRIAVSSNAGVTPNRAGEEVRTVSLDSCVAGQPTLVKIDIEGLEAEALGGAQRLLSSRPKLAIELHPKQLRLIGSSVKEVLDLIPHSYDLWIQWSDDRDPESYDGSPIKERTHLFALPDG